jgi:hypothetical protein
MRESIKQNRGTNWRQWDIEEKEEYSRKEGNRNKVETVVYSEKKRNIAVNRERKENRGTKRRKWYTE